MRETFILDVYQSHLIREGDVILDLGSTTGDFCVLASRKVGPRGTVIAIEPNVDDYEILRQNITRNGCLNIKAVNIGVSARKGEMILQYMGRKWKCNTDTLVNILEATSVASNIDFIKMDIEGFELDVISSSMDIFARARVVVLEFHGTKERIDKLLIPLGFTYHPVTTIYLCKKLLSKAISHPIHFTKALISMIKANPKLIYRLLFGYDVTQNAQGIFVGYYTKS